MKRIVGLAVLAAAFSAFAGAPVVTVNSVSQDEARKVTVNFSLSGEPGVVTFAAQTNNGTAWVEIEDKSAFRCCQGDVNRLIAPSNDHRLVWHADKAWPGHDVSGSGFRVALKAWATNAPPDYMIADLITPETLRYYEYAESVPDGVLHSRYKESKMIFRKIPAAGVEWVMGRKFKASATYELSTYRPHTVILSKDYYFAIFPTTRCQFRYIWGGYSTDQYPTNALPKHRPVYDLTEANINSFMSYYTEKTGLKVAFPTEAQWEFACRAGTTTDYYRKNPTVYSTSSGSATDELSAEEKTDYAWVPDSSADKSVGTRAVGQTIPNDFGIYDLYGNVWEMCSDYHADYPEGPVIDPVGVGTVRAARGGSHYWAAYSWTRRGSNGDRNGYRLSAPAEVVK